MSAKWMTGAWLAQEYKRLNRKWFNNTLPSDVRLRWTRGFRPPNNTFVGRTRNTRRVGASTNSTASGYSITLSTRMQGMAFVMMTLLHEMAHVATWGEKKSHGPRWQAEMLRLAQIGAFKEWW